MKFDIITIFPDIFDSYFNESILGRAQKKKLVKIKAHDLRKWTMNRHKTVDDRPYGGGAGMILKVEPLYRAVQQISNFHSRSRGTCSFSIFKQKRKNIKRRIILFSAKGRTMTQADVRRWAKYDQLILVCGRYEGVDERVVRHVVNEEVSVGSYVLTGGEIPAMMVVDAVSRLIPGVLGKKESLREESFSQSSSYLEYPQYTRPEEFKGWKVPKILLSGDHAKIKAWRKKHSKSK